jgi:hypothetical protein
VCAGHFGPLDRERKELQLDLVGAASTTFDREDLTQGFEPDACFYLQDAARVRGRKRIDLAVDPPLSPASASIQSLAACICLTIAVGSLIVK